MPAELAASRRAWRKALLERRAALPPAERTRADAAIAQQLRAALEGEDGTLGFYWPIQSEFDARPAVTDWLLGGGLRRAALPVVVRRNAPLIFRAWTPATVMRPAGFGTSVPADGETLVPAVLLVPLVGFDDAGYRLGYGGGYYDRTLAALQPRPRTLGIGYAACRLDSIVPQAFDLRLDRLIIG
ncbi:MAG: 5-formyltetrahydrofolate cyclo-ligase [Burkholderiales bacterium]|nr:5-formyltetrahydrofolate cyclo-ligase [Burkholderiales bacterium]